MRALCLLALLALVVGQQVSTSNAEDSDAVCEASSLCVPLESCLIEGTPCGGNKTCCTVENVIEEKSDLDPKEISGRSSSFTNFTPNVGQNVNATSNAKSDSANSRSSGYQSGFPYNSIPFQTHSRFNINYNLDPQLEAIAKAINSGNPIDKIDQKPSNRKSDRGLSFRHPPSGPLYNHGIVTDFDFGNRFSGYYPNQAPYLNGPTPHNIVPYGSFNHAFGSPYGQFAPDFYSSYSSHSLNPYAAQLLQKHRYTSCGIRSSSFVFPLPPYSLDPYGQQNVHGLSNGGYGQQPWQAAVLGWAPEGYALRCSATLISSYLLVTSAHCISGILESDLKIIFGADDLLLSDPLFPVIERPVAKIFVHEKYESGTLAHDIALLVLPRPIHFHQTPHIAPACLPKSDQKFTPSKCRIVGWPQSGLYGVGNQNTNEVQVTEMRILTTDACSAQITSLAPNLDSSKLTPEMHCIKGKENSESCIAASGGSLLCEASDTESSNCHGRECSGNKYFLAGIVSWSNDLCGTNGLAVITEMSPYVKWIEELVAVAGGIEHFDPSYFGLPGQYNQPPAHGFGYNSGYGFNPGYGSSIGYGGYLSNGYGSASYGGYGGSHGAGYGYSSPYGSGYGNYNSRPGYSGYGNYGGAYGGSYGYSGNNYNYPSSGYSTASYGYTGGYSQPSSNYGNSYSRPYGSKYPSSYSKPYLGSGY